VDIMLKILQTLKVIWLLPLLFEETLPETVQAEIEAESTPVAPTTGT